MRPDLATLTSAFQSRWGADTALDPSAWSPECPERGQCAVTACLVHEILDLPVLRGEVHFPDGRSESHYWNGWLDLTAGQFPDGTAIYPRQGPQGVAAYHHALSHPDTARRAAILRDRLERFLSTSKDRSS